MRGYPHSYPDSSISVGLSDANVSVSLDISSLCTTERLEILDVIVDIFDGKGEDFYSHTADIRGSNFSHQLGELITILVDGFHAQRTCKIDNNLKH